MIEPLDPYHKWLGIPPSEQPPNLYRLLGLRLFESDQEVIAAAAVQRMAFVRKFQKGETDAQAQKIAKEIKNAWACLIFVEKRQLYDKQLRGQIKAPPDSAAFENSALNLVSDGPLPLPTVQGFEAVPSTSGPMLDLDFLAKEHPTRAKRGSARSRRRKSSSLVMQIIAPFLGLAIGYLILCQFGPEYDFLGLMHSAATRNAQPKITRTVEAVKKTEPAEPSISQRHVADRPTSRKWWSAYNPESGAFGLAQSTTQPPENPERKWLGPFDTREAALAAVRPKLSSNGQPFQPNAVPQQRNSPRTQQPVASPAPIAVNQTGSVEEDNAKSKPLSKRLPIPDDAAQAPKKDLIARVYKLDSAITAQEKIELAEKLIGVAKETNDDAVGKFVLLQIAETKAIEAGNWELAFDSVDQLSQAYDLDGLKAKTEALTALQSQPKPPEIETMITGVETALDQAVASKRFDLASNLSKLAKSASQRVDAVQPDNTAADSADELNETASVYENVAAAFDSLASNATNANANFIVGMYYCFSRGEWNTGLPMLAIGSDDALKGLAGTDLTETKSPTQEAQLADEWWQFADNLSGHARVQTRSRAVYWYRHSLPKLSGLTKVSADERIKDFETRMSSKAAASQPLPTTAETLERKAQQCRTADEAYSLYKEFFASDSISTDEKKAATERLAYWEKAASKGLIRAGGTLITRAEAQNRRDNARGAIRQALDLVRTNAPQATKELEEASQVDPNDPEADFLIGAIQAGINGDFQASKAHFTICLRRQPDNPRSLNNLAVALVMTGDYLSAVKQFQIAMASGAPAAEVVHNLRHLAYEVAQHSLTMSSSTAVAYSSLMGHVSADANNGQDDRLGWLYLVPVSDLDANEPTMDYGLLASMGKLRVNPDGHNDAIENRVCIRCRGSGLLTCPTCHGRGTVSEEFSAVTGYTMPLGLSNTRLPIAQTQYAHKTCPTCKGKGTVGCDVCGGKGHER